MRIRTMGSVVLHNHPVDSLSFSNGIAEATVGDEVFRAKEAVLATGDQSLVSDLPKTKVLRTFVIGYEKHGMPEILRSSIMWDNEEPYHYIRSFKGTTLWV